MKICALVANFTHSVIITNNFVRKDFKKCKVVFITQNSQKDKLNSFVSNYFKNKTVDFVEWGDETNTYSYDFNTIFAVYGSDLFIARVNRYINMLKLSNMVIDLYDITSIKCSVEDIVLSHDYFLNSSGIKVKK